MSASHERELYEAWVELLSWMREYAREKGVRFEKEADFPDFIYRMERPYDLPTTIMTASLSDALGEPFLLADVSPRHAKLKRIGLRLPRAHIHLHAHYEPGKGLVTGKIPLTKERFFALADRAREALAFA
ncbi:NADH-quinone oxidoreductase subunit 15 [Thermus caldilimi]|uniref:NADH-quinone oxidoreductase subunit 15 n=1 Tax=Thermus caldilimi TaxID=2483360 RepID=UPI0010762144|nr:NADH-quinone oxidoreductase subunit 15 [Thermus caldilimi]